MEEEELELGLGFGLEQELGFVVQLGELVEQEVLEDYSLLLCLPVVQLTACLSLAVLLLLLLPPRPLAQEAHSLQC